MAGNDSGSSARSVISNVDRVAPDDDRAVTLVPLLNAIAHGDADAMRILIFETEGRLRAIALRLLRDHDDVDEIIQDVYLTVWKKAARYEAGRAHPLAWLTVITRNRCLDRLRQRAVRRGAKPDGWYDRPTSAPEADESEWQQRLGRLHERLDGLDAKTRDAIKAAFFDGQTYEALARAHNVPLGTMKSRIRRGLLALRAALRP